MEEVNPSPKSEGKVIQMVPQEAPSATDGATPQPMEQPKPPTPAEIAEMKRQRSEYVKALKEDYEVLKLETDTMELRLKKLQMINMFKQLQQQNAHTDIPKTVLSPEGTDSAGTASAE